MREVEVGGRTLALAVSPVVGYANLYGHDVTDRIRAEAERADLEAQLRQSQKLEAIGRLAGGIAHDFNNQLTVIRGYCDLLRSELAGQELAAEPVLHIRRAADQAAALTSQLLAYSRRQILRPKVVCLNDLLTEVVEPVRRMVGEDVALELETDPTLGRVYADPVQMQQAVINLAVNARDAMPGGGRLTFETFAADAGTTAADETPGATPGPYVGVRVTDTGAGMDAETRERVFDPFFTTKPVGQGTGLGLAMVYGFVKQSGGAVRVASEPGRGTAVTILLPVTEREPEATDRKSATGTARAGAASPTCVLVVEDEPSVRALVVRVLERAGHHVCVATCPAEALDLPDTPEAPFDLLISDVVMPGMNGPALVAELRERWPGLPVLFTSGYAEDAIARHGFGAEGEALLAKPFTPEDLLEAVAGVLDRAEDAAGA